MAVKFGVNFVTYSMHKQDIKGVKNPNFMIYLHNGNKWVQY